MRAGRQENVIRRHIEDGIEEYMKAQRIERCGTLTRWDEPLPEAISVRGPSIRLPDGTVRSVSLN